MTLDDLAALESFALLGPGFGGGAWRLVAPLAPCDPLAPHVAAGPRLVFCAFEQAGRDALRVTGPVRPLPPDFMRGADPGGSLHAGLDARGHADAVARIRGAIAAGDVYQVNFTLRANLAAVSGATLLAALVRRDVPRFAAWVRLPDRREFVSASPELLFACAGRAVRAEPMKGTAPPGDHRALFASAKDAAELAMITDLVRNDLWPVCDPGTVHVACARRTLALPYALQAVSDVRGTLREGVTPEDVLAALHPGGSVTGAPKNAALALIRALEESPRGAYCGALGWCEGPDAVFSLLIRTAERTAGGPWVYGVGGGIVYDSDAAAELDEVRLKLGALP